MSTRTTAVSDDLLDLLARGLTRDQLIAFRPSASTQARLERLLSKSRQGKLSEAESHELDDFETIEHIVRLLKARIPRKRGR